MLAKINAVGLQGVEGFQVSVEVDESNGIPRSVVVGNVGGSVREAMERAYIALKNSGFEVPPKRLTVNLSPADIRKEGTAYDLPIVAGMLQALQMVPALPLAQYAFFGEIGLDGSVRHVRGTLSMVTALKAFGFRGVVLPLEDVQEALVVEGMDIIGVASVAQLKHLLSSGEQFASFPRQQADRQPFREAYSVDFSEVRGQSYGVRAALICAAGGHNLLLSGTAGSGKTMIAKRIPSIMPPLSREENIEISKLYSICGLLPKGQALLNQRPFRTPHHSVTVTAFTGGQSAYGITPGELSLADRGVLFLDELPLFNRHCIEALRQPLEEQRVVINRMRGSYSYPADCILVGAMNPCQCGYFPDREKCHCTPQQIRAYQRGISKPILERIDICAEAAPVSFDDALEKTAAVSSAELREQVVAARARQTERFRETAHIRVNARMGMQELQQHCRLSDTGLSFMRKVFEQKRLSMRTYHKVLRVARTIADLERAENIEIKHLAEAVAYRGLEERLGTV